MRDTPEFNEAMLAPHGVLAAGFVERVLGTGEIEAGEFPEVGLAMDAVAHAGAVPAIAEDAIELVEGHDLAYDGGHELEVVGAEGAGNQRAGPA